MAESTIVGRDREVDRLTQAVEDAAQGRGSVWHLTGEPGIGKSRLAEEAARIARARGLRTFWGRCWEAGGAPPYWPWVQVLRAVLRTAEPRHVEPHQAALSQILPELPPLETMPEAVDLSPGQARFQLMDAVSNVLADAAQRLPLVVVLEDLHVADVSTVLLLEFLSSTVRHQPLLIVATYRELELASAPAGAQLSRAAQQGQRIALERLGKDDVASFLVASGDSADASFVDALHRTTDGLPLFLVEVARLWQAQGRTGDEAHLSIPPSVSTAIEERLKTVTPSCIHTLRCGSVVGREFDIGLLEACHGRNRFVEAAQEAVNASILVEIAPQRYRFAHFLIRGTVYDSIGEQEREAAHARLAEILESALREDMPRWTEVAHHYAAAGRVAEAARAYREAGAQGLRQLAFDEAVRGYESALDAASRAGNLDPRHRTTLLIELAHAKTRAGDVAAAKEACMTAARLAREIDDAELLTRAALEHGTALQYTRVDPELIALLEEALDALGPADSALRARAMARLAAAQQPADDPEGPMQLARDAIAMARRLGDPDTLLDTLRNGGSTMVDLGDLDERVVLDRELAALAEELGNAVEALRGNVRSVMDYLALERFDDAYRAMRACERITEELHHPAYGWRPVAMRALRALWEGRLDEAELLIDEARALGERGSDPHAETVYTVQRLRLLTLRGAFDAHSPLLERLQDQLAVSEFGRATAKMMLGWVLAFSGRLELARDCWDPDTVRRLLRVGDQTVLLAMARICVTAEDRGLAERLYRQMMVQRDHIVTGGILFMVIEGPMTWGLAWIARFLGRYDEASEHFEQALEVARRSGGRPTKTLIGIEYAKHLAESGVAAAAERAAAVAGEAAKEADELGMEAARADAEAFLRGLGNLAKPSVDDPPEDLSMTKAGDSWLVSYGNVEFHLKDVRGVRMLASLVNEPGRELHVLDLSGAPKTGAPPIDRGDSGETIDEEARRQYGARILELREELEEAESWNDPGRAERTRKELETLERELSRALGLGGRERRTGSAAERARVNVQRRIRDAIRRIESYHPGLAKHLDRAVRTGAFCVYEP